MNSKEMKKLRRADLLRIIVRQQEKIEQLEDENQKLQSRLEERILVCEETGNLAMAAMEINRIFEQVQLAADQYLESVKASAPSDLKQESSDEQ